MQDAPDRTVPEPIAPASAPPPDPRHRRVRRYSMLVRWMKILLPLAALGLIALIFVTAREKGELADLFSPEELAVLGAGLKLENPRFAGMTSKGEAFSLRADWALPDSAMPNQIELERPHAQIALADGRTVTAAAAKGWMRRTPKTLTLEGEVVVESSDGYRIETGLVEVDLDAKTAQGPGAIVATGPRGRLQAGSFHAAAGSDGAGKSQIWFENRVRLVFIPAEGAD